MALTKNLILVDNFGIEVNIPNLYIKVARIDCDKEKVSAVVEIKKSADAFPIKTETYRFNHNLDAGNIISQAYNYIKTLPEYAGAADC